MMREHTHTHYVHTRSEDISKTPHKSETRLSLQWTKLSSKYQHWAANSAGVGLSVPLFSVFVCFSPSLCRADKPKLTPPADSTWTHVCVFFLFTHPMSVWSWCRRVKSPNPTFWKYAVWGHEDSGQRFTRQKPSKKSKWDHKHTQWVSTEHTQTVQSQTPQRRGPFFFFSFGICAFVGCQVARLEKRS